MAIDHRVARGFLVVVHPGVYAVGHSNLTARGRWLAAVFACGEAAVLGYQSAAALWALAKTSRSLIDVVRPIGSGRAPRGIKAHRSRILRATDRTEIDGIPVTSLSRTLLDYAEAVSPHRLELAIEVAVRREILDMAAMAELLDRSNGRRGVKPLRAMLSLPSGAIETKSPLERRFLRFCDEHGLPRPQINVVRGEREVDAYFPQTRLVVELDSVEFHQTARAFEDDRAKDIALQLAGERVVRVTDKRMKLDGDRLAAELRALVAKN
jgi:hypothetical protein